MIVNERVTIVVVFCVLTGATVGIGGFGILVLMIVAGAQALAGAA